MEIKRIYAPGSEWLYIKIYSGAMVLEKMLLDKVFPLTCSMIDDNLIDKFFFVRYLDPDYHLRLKFHINDIDNVGKVLFRLRDTFEEDIKNHIIYRYEADTYVREIERYGAQQIADFETLFFNDSIFIINCLRSFPGYDNDRWITCCIVMNKYFDCLNFSLEERMDFCKTMSEAYNIEFFKDLKDAKIQMGNKYRYKKDLMFKMLGNEKANRLTTYTNQIMSFINNVTPEYAKTKLKLIIHMHVNRMFRTQQRAIECVIYNLMWKYYISVKAIQSNKENNEQ